MDLLSDIPDFVRSEICGSTPPPLSASSTKNPFWQKWNDLGLVVEKLVTPETSFQELTLRDLLASLPLNSVQGIDANGLWSSTAFPSDFKFTTHQHFQHLVSQSISDGGGGGVTTFVLESPSADVCVQNRIVRIPKITNAATFVFFLQHFQLRPASSSVRPTTSNVTATGMEIETPEDDDGDGDGEEVNVTYSATPLANLPSTITPMDVGIIGGGGGGGGVVGGVKDASATDVDSYLQRWKRGDTNGRTGKPTVEKIAEMAGITQLDLKKWLATKGTTWTQMLIKHGFRDDQKRA